MQRRAANRFTLCGVRLQCRGTNTSAPYGLYHIELERLLNPCTLRGTCFPTKFVRSRVCASREQANLGTFAGMDARSGSSDGNIAHACRVSGTDYAAIRYAFAGGRSRVRCPSGSSLPPCSNFAAVVCVNATTEVGPDGRGSPPPVWELRTPSAVRRGPFAAGVRVASAGRSRSRPSAGRRARSAQGDGVGRGAAPIISDTARQRPARLSRRPSSA